MSSDRGFTLVEALVALMILALGLAAFGQTLGAGLNGAATAERERRAAAAAENLLAELGHSRPLQDGVSEGDTPDGMHWLLVIKPLDQPEREEISGQLEGHAVQLAIGDRESSSDRKLVVQTLLLGSAP